MIKLDMIQIVEFQLLKVLMCENVIKETIVFITKTLKPKIMTFEFF